MYQLLPLVVTWLFFWGSTAGIMVYDGWRARAQAKQHGVVDFQDRSIRSYLLLSALFGGFVLVFYFWATRKSAKGLLLGIGVFVAATVATGIVQAAINPIARALDFASVERACTTLVPGSDADDGRDGAYRYPDERKRLVELGCKAVGISPCLDLNDLTSPDPYGTMAALTKEPVERTEAWKRGEALCKQRPASAPRGRCSVYDSHTPASQQ